jgi:phosphonate transport system substrate-binding protein
MSLRHGARLTFGSVMATAATTSSNPPCQFGLPPSVGATEAENRAGTLQAYLERAMRRPVIVSVCRNYSELSRDVLAGKLDACWAPPFACARLEKMGARVLLRDVRRGASTYRAVLLGRTEAALTIESLNGKVAAWTDKSSVAGYMLPMALLRSRGLEPQTLFSAQRFLGTFRAALEEVVSGRADVTSIFAPSAASGGAVVSGLDELAPEWRRSLAPVAITEECANDGVVVSASAPADVVTALEKALIDLATTSAGARVAADIFRIDRFERAEPGAYRSLYKLALASV